jgi:transcriptional regulator with XRE-family HTH domain
MSKPKSGLPIGILEIARRTKFSPAHISKIFSGRRNPSFGAAALIASAMHISLDELYMRLVNAQGSGRAA